MQHHTAAEGERVGGDPGEHVCGGVGHAAVGQQAEVQSAEVGERAIWRRLRGELGGKPSFDLRDRFFDAAVELDTRPAVTVERQARGLELAAHDVVRDFFAAVFEQQRGGDIRMHHIAVIRALEEPVHRLAAEPAAFAVRERHEARDALVASELLRVELFGREARDLRRAHARGQDQSDPLGGDAGVGAEGGEGGEGRGGRRISSLGTGCSTH